MNRFRSTLVTELHYHAQRLKSALLPLRKSIYYWNRGAFARDETTDHAREQSSQTLRNLIDLVTLIDERLNAEIDISSDDAVSAYAVEIDAYVNRYREIRNTIQRLSNADHTLSLLINGPIKTQEDVIDAMQKIMDEFWSNSGVQTPKLKLPFKHTDDYEVIDETFEISPQAAQVVRILSEIYQAGDTSFMKKTDVLKKAKMDHTSIAHIFRNRHDGKKQNRKVYKKIIEETTSRKSIRIRHKY